MNIPVITVGATAGDLVTGLERLRGPVTVVRRCSEFAELLAACQSGIARAAIVADEAGDITGSLVERLATAEVAVVVLTDDPGTCRRLDALGVSHASSRIAAADLAAAVAAAVDDLAGGKRAGTGRDYADTAESLHDLGSVVPDAGVQPLVKQGRITAVWGPTGAPGRTTVAVNVAAELAATGKSVLLIDADTYGAAIAASLGLLDESAGLAHACRLADQGALDGAALARVGTEVVVKGARIRVLTGITRPDRWPELRGSALLRVLEEARLLADETVIDCGFCLEADEELSFDTMAPRRNGSTLVSLELADVILAVGAADSIGMPRLVRALAQLENAVPTASPQVVFNRVRASAVGRVPERQLREAWERFGPAHQIHAYLPADNEAADAALLAGSALLEAAPASALRRGIAALCGAPSGRPRGHASRPARSALRPK